MTSVLASSAAPQLVHTLRGNPLAWRLAAVLAVTGAVVAHDHSNQTSHYREQIETVAAWRYSEVRQWLDALQAQVRLLQGSSDWRAAQWRWLESGDETARDALLTQASEVVRHFGGHSVWLLNEQGGVLATDADAPEPVSGALRLAVDQSLRGDIVRQTGLYPAARLPGRVWFDTVVPLMAPGKAVRAALVLRVDASAGLLRRLGRWAGPTVDETRNDASGVTPAETARPVAIGTGTAAGLATTRLARVEDGRLFIGDERGARPVESSDSLLGRAVRGKLPLGLAAEGEGTDGQAVLGVVQRVPQTDWYVLVQVHRSDLRAAGQARTLKILLAGTLVLLGMAVFAAWRGHRLWSGPARPGPGLRPGSRAAPPAGRVTATADSGVGSGAAPGRGSGDDSPEGADPAADTCAPVGPVQGNAGSSPDRLARQPVSAHPLRQFDTPSAVRDVGAQQLQPVPGAPRSPVHIPATQDEGLRTLAGARVLLVEDSFINQEVAREALVSAGMQVVVAGDGDQALQQLQRAHFDVVLMDVQMPVMDGLEATRRLRAMPGLQHLPVLAMTASAYDEQRRACLAAGMNDHLAKPIDLEQLYATLARWLSPHPVVGAAERLQLGDEPPARQPVQAAATSIAAAASAEPGIAHGLNCVKALVNLAGREDLYHRVLARFLSHHASLHEDLPRWRAAADIGSTQRALHSLRGASVAVGAESLSQCTQAAEAALAAAGAELPHPAATASHPVDRALAAVLQELRYVEDHIRSLLAPGDPTGAPTAVVHEPSLDRS